MAVLPKKTLTVYLIIDIGIYASYPSGMNANDEIAALITLAERFSGHQNKSLSTVSLLATGAGHYFKTLAQGEMGLTFRRREKILNWFSANWPADLDWPADISRPSTKEDAA